MANFLPNEIFRKKMENENTPYLIRIMEIHNGQEWSEEEFVMIADILRARGESIPAPLLPDRVPLESQPQAPTWLPGALVALGLGLAFLVLYYNGEYLASQALYRDLANEGRTISATITDLQPYVAPGSDDFTTYWVQYSFFALINGQQNRISNCQRIPEPVYSSLVKGQLIEVVYDVADPTKSAVNPKNWVSIYTYPPLIVMLAIGIGGLAYLIYINFRTRRAYKNQFPIPK